MNRQKRNPEPSLSKYPAEYFGFPYTNKEDKVNKMRSKQHCPFLKAECKKPRKSQPEIKIGVCSVGYKGSVSDKFIPVIICPHRFEVDSISSEIVKNYFPNTKNIEWVPEVSLGAAGSVDYALVKINGGEIEDFACVEMQAAGTTGTPWEAVKDFKKSGKFFKKNYKFGINWANEFAKTMMQQAYKKGIIIESWGKKLIFVIQDVGLAYLEEYYDTSGLHEAKDDDPIHFLTFKMKWDEKTNLWDFELDKKLSTDSDGIRKMLSGPTVEKHPSIEEFIENIKRKKKQIQKLSKDQRLLKSF